MSDTGMLIRERRKRAGLTVDELAKRAGCSKALISQIENGKDVESAGFYKMMSISQTLGIDPFDLLDLSKVKREISSKVNNCHMLPVLSLTQALSFYSFTGIGADSQDMPVITVQGDFADSLSEQGFALVVVGTDNAPDYKNGDQVVIDPREPMNPGDMIVAYIDGFDEAIMRIYRPRGKDSAGEIVELAPINSDHPTYRLDKDNAGKIIGVVVKHTRDPRPK